ncbi:MAG: class I SAM-dependent methyltransferase [Owenweeksia sp.]
MIVMAMEQWYRSWFDSPYYHLLYAHRDDTEAGLFIENLARELRMPAGSHVLDLACGRGRHSLMLHQMGFRVTGIDLSPSNIQYARKATKHHLNFEVGDMRADLGEDRFDYIFNLFTSFGYFERKEENIKACQAMARSLKPGGKLILDFLNVHKVELGLVEEEVKEIEGIRFHIERFIRDGMVIKKISFTDKGEEHFYEEKVQLLTKNNFEELLAQGGLRIDKCYGGFNLDSFDFRNSERLILFASLCKPC